jgi:hypothetical protein
MVVGEAQQKHEEGGDDDFNGERALLADTGPIGGDAGIGEVKNILEKGWGGEITDPDDGDDEGDEGADEDADAATEGFGIFVNFAATRVIDETEFGSDCSHQPGGEPGEEKTHGYEGENCEFHSGWMRITGWGGINKIRRCWIEECGLRFGFWNVSIRGLDGEIFMKLGYSFEYSLMQCRGGGRHPYGPKFFSRLPRTPSTLFRFP